MKGFIRIFFLFFCLFGLLWLFDRSLGFCQPTRAADTPYRIFTSDGQPLGSDWAGVLREYPVILFGEYHNQPLLHQLEWQLLQELHRQNPHIVLSLEMFEKDVQPQLTAYVQGHYSEASFLANSRPWKNYTTDYRPLIEYAKKQSIPVLAANIPRRLAAQYARTGTLDQLPLQESYYLPRIYTAPEGLYHEKFLATMAANAGKGMSLPFSTANAYKAQCLKDAAMAESLYHYRLLHPNTQILHIQGDFHGRQHLGTAAALKLLAPHWKVAVIAPVSVETLSLTAENIARHKQDGDILIFFQS